jgi:hypothetical protein
MPTQEFTGASLEEARQACERRQRAHCGVTITKELRPVGFLYGGVPFGEKPGPSDLLSVMIALQYEDQNQERGTVT